MTATPLEESGCARMSAEDWCRRPALGLDGLVLQRLSEVRNGWSVHRGEVIAKRPAGFVDKELWQHCQTRDPVSPIEAEAGLCL